jgi:hypothetical protein
MSLSHHDSAAIKERCFKLIPSLQKARVLQECVGLRPHRSVVRVEAEVLGKLKVSQWKDLYALCTTGSNSTGK